MLQHCWLGARKSIRPACVCLIACTCSDLLSYCSDSRSIASKSLWTTKLKQRQWHHAAQTIDWNAWVRTRPSGSRLKSPRTDSRVDVPCSDWLRPAAMAWSGDPSAPISSRHLHRTRWLESWSNCIRDNTINMFTICLCRVFFTVKLLQVAQMTDWVMVLHPTRHTLSHFGDVSQANLLTWYGKN